MSILKELAIFLASLVIIFSAGCREKNNTRIPALEIVVNKSASWYRGRCDHNSKELAVVVGVLYKKLHEGKLPKSLEEVYWDRKIREILGGAPQTEEYYCPLPVNGKLKMYVYHKPPPNAPEDYIVLECPNHPDNKWTLLNIGAAK